MRPNWTQEEQQYLKTLIQGQQRKRMNWISLADHLNKKFPNKTRNGKQCRQKYINYLKYQQNDHQENEWTQLQEDKLLQNFESFGSQWTKIQKDFPSRSENYLKNKMNGMLRKLIRRLNVLGKQKINNYSKMIKMESISKIMQGAFKKIEFKRSLAKKCEQLKEAIINLLKEKLDIQETVTFIKSLHQFNMETRCYSKRKSKKPQCFSLIQDSEEKLISPGSTPFEVPLHYSEPIQILQQKCKPLELFQFDKEDFKKKNLSEKCMSDLDEEVSNIFGREHISIGFSYFEQN